MQVNLKYCEEEKKKEHHVRVEKIFWQVALSNAVSYVYVTSL